jgi:hypothetical protein
MEVINRGVLRGGGISPGFGIEVKTEDDIRFDLLIDTEGAGVDFGDAIEELFALPLERKKAGFSLDAGIAIGRCGEAGLPEGFGSERTEIPRGFCRDGLRMLADEGNIGTEGSETLLENAGSEKGEVPFLDGLSRLEAEVTLLHDAKVAADVAGVDSNVEITQRGATGEGRQLRGTAPEPGRLCLWLCPS